MLFCEFDKDPVQALNNGRGVNLNKLAWDSNFTAKVRISYSIIVSFVFDGVDPIGSIVKLGLAGSVSKITNTRELNDNVATGIENIGLEISLTPGFLR